MPWPCLLVGTLRQVPSESLSWTNHASSTLAIGQPRAGAGQAVRAVFMTCRRAAR
jgi:hypothetical protein